MSNTELKPCPFCGGKATLRTGVLFRTEAFVKCNTCKCRTITYKGGDHEDTVYLAVAAWNRRAENE